MGLLEIVVDVVGCLGGHDPVLPPGSTIVRCSRCTTALAELESHHVELTGEDHADVAE